MSLNAWLLIGCIGVAAVIAAIGVSAWRSTDRLGGIGLVVMSVAFVAAGTANLVFL